MNITEDLKVQPKLDFLAELKLEDLVDDLEPEDLVDLLDLELEDLFELMILAEGVV